MEIKLGEKGQAEGFFPWGFLQSKKGQSSLTDSMFFLVIAGILSTWLFYESATYGSTIDQQISRQGREEYTKSALETILYSSVPRQAGVSLEEAKEIDYLLAAIKEDYADDAELNETKAILFQNINAVMQPIATNTNYLFYIYLPEKSKFVVTLLYASEAENDGGWSLTGNKIVFSCAPTSKQAVEEFLLTVGRMSVSNSRIQLLESKEPAPDRYDAIITLITWIPTPVEQSKLTCVEFTG
ncbi:MAG: hypothetical protein Q8N60_03515 [Candidatus Diapherotrites archaeon]|nr:hypothetical protein [Candidatus Diapherotrites archaeon]